MFMGDGDIEDLLSDQDSGFSITPRPTRIQPSSVELHLGNQFREYERPMKYGLVIDPELGEPDMRSFNVADGEPFALGPKQFILAHTKEIVQFPDDFAGQVDGKSSLARLGLQVHMTSGFIDPGFTGQITLEMFNAAPYSIILRPKMVIAQMFVIAMSMCVNRPYGSPGLDSHYQNQVGAVGYRRKPTTDTGSEAIAPLPANLDISHRWYPR